MTEPPTEQPHDQHARTAGSQQVSQEPQGLVERMEHHQIAIYLGAMALGGLLCWAAPAAGPGLEHAINPVLGALLFVTFLQVPAGDLFRSLRDGRFLSAALVVNFAVVPVVVAAMFAFLPADQALRGSRDPRRGHHPALPTQTPQAQRPGPLQLHRLHPGRRRPASAARPGCGGPRRR